MKRSYMKAGQFPLALLAAAIIMAGTATESAFATGDKTSAWQVQFEEVSRPAANAMELSVGQLETLLARCEALKGEMGDTLDESARKVYGRRLQMTCDLYRFMLDARKAAAAEEAK